jgi:hypothetical protein
MKLSLQAFRKKKPGITLCPVFAPVIKLPGVADTGIQLPWRLVVILTFGIVRPGPSAQVFAEFHIRAQANDAA